MVNRSRGVAINRSSIAPSEGAKFRRTGVVKIRIIDIS